MCPSPKNVALKRAARLWLSGAKIGKGRTAVAKRARPSPKLNMMQRKVVGTEGSQSYLYECSRFVWRNKREHCALEADRKFQSRRMALLYVAKMNSDSLNTYLTEVGKRWHDICSGTGRYAITPNMPFNVEQFLELSDDSLEKYGAEVRNALTVHKAPQGTTYRFKAVPLVTTQVDELCQILAS